MNSLNLFILAWTLSGGLAWRVATHHRQGSRPLWAVLGQVFGPLAIPFAFMVKAKA